ncbi:MAG: hypothetical protein K1W27_13490 [Lachnospiraceae bacterium]|jgi:hypothetical protein|nr:hypothetical protein C804_03074 [Lachnospiraceae bacterium A4]
MDHNLLDKENFNQNQNQNETQSLNQNQNQNQLQSSEQGQFQQPYQQQTTYQQTAYQQPYQQSYQQQPYQTGNSDLEEPVSFADWMLTTLVMFIPCVNIIMLCVWAFGAGTKKSKSNYCKAMLVWMLISVVLSFVLGGVFMATIAAIMQEQGMYY